MSLEGTATLCSGQPPLPDPRWHLQQPKEATLGLGPDAVSSLPGAGVHRRCRGDQVSRLERDMKDYEVRVKRSKDSVIDEILKKTEVFRY